MSQNLTKAQEEIFNFIKETLEQTGMPPSYREIQKHFNYKAIGTVQDHVKALMNKGVIEKPRGETKSARGIIPKNVRLEQLKKIPIYGEIAAGALRESEQVTLGNLVVDQTVSTSPSFALKVVGNSMIEVGIYEGDVLIVEKNATIKNGDIVVALVEGETTVKRFHKKNGQTLLIPENKTMKPIDVTSRKLEIQGKVVGLQRKIH